MSTQGYPPTCPHGTNLAFYCNDCQAEAGRDIASMGAADASKIAKTCPHGVPHYHGCSVCQMNEMVMEAKARDAAPPAPPAMPHAHALFEEAERLINGPRKDAYGHYTDEAASIAAMWTELLRDVLKPGASVVARKVPLMMIALKLNRMKVREHGDSRLDTCGYAGLLAELEAARGTQA